MRLALVISRLGHRGGAERLTGDLAGALAGRGHEVTLLTAAFDESVWPEFRGAFPVEIHPPRAQASSARALRPDVILAMDHAAWRSLGAGRRRGDPPLGVYFHGLLRRLEWKASERHLLARLAQAPGSVPEELRGVIASRRRASRSPFRRLRHAAERRRDRRARAATDLFLANSETTAEGLRLAGGIEARTCPPGIRFPETDPRYPRDGLLVATALRAKKNVATVLEALALLAERGGPTPRLTILGGGPREEAIRRRAGELRLSDRVELPGVAADAELDRRLRSARALVHVPVGEPFGLIVVEALVRGTPVVVSDHGGPSEIATEGVDGRLVDPFDPAAVATGIRRVLEAPPDADGPRSRARLAHLSIESMARRVETALAN